MLREIKNMEGITTRGIARLSVSSTHQKNRPRDATRDA